MRYDAIVVGGGPAGLSAALVLARCRRMVLVIDGGKPRNYAAQHIHNFLTRDGVPPQRFARLARDEAARYGAEFKRGHVTRTRCTRDGFVVGVKGRASLNCRTLLLATGVRDELPSLQNIDRFYGRGVHHCPYCDAWEYRDRPVAAYGEGAKGVGLATVLLTWSRRVTVLTGGKRLRGVDAARAAALGMAVRHEPLKALHANPRNRSLGRVEFASGADLAVDAVFFNTEKVQRSTLPRTLGCRINREGGVIRDRKQNTGVPGLYLAGDASFDVQFVVVAAAEGAKAGVSMNRYLQDLDQSL